MLSKEECEESLEEIESIYYNLDGSFSAMKYFKKNLEKMYELIKEHFEFKEKYSKLLDDIHDYRYETYCMKSTIRNLCKHFGVESEKDLQNIYLNKPYKFEDLKEGMWIWDIKLKWAFKIVSVDIGIEALKHYVFKVENRDESTSLINFEENRFFLLWMANNEVVDNE